MNKIIKCGVLGSHGVSRDSSLNFTKNGNKVNYITYSIVTVLSVILNANNNVAIPPKPESCSIEPTGSFLIDID